MARLPSALGSDAPHPPGPLPAEGHRQLGYNLVILMFMIAVINIMIAVATPAWTHLVKREKEAELIHRGLQYAEAIRVFQKNHGRLPLKLEELVELEPRSIRQLFPNPMSKDGKWGLLVQGAVPGRRGVANNPLDRREDSQTFTQSVAGGNRPRPTGPRILGDGQVSGRLTYTPLPPSKEKEGFGRTTVTNAPIVGVYSATDEESLRSFMEATSYQDWHFTMALIPVPTILGGDAPIPRVTSAWIGRPFQKGLQAVGAGQNPGQPPSRNQGQELTRPLGSRGGALDRRPSRRNTGGNLDRRRNR